MITVRPGPVVYVWRDGAELIAVPMTPLAALELASRLLTAVQMAGLPNENLPFAEHLARRDVEREPHK